MTPPSPYGLPETDCPGCPDAGTPAVVGAGESVGVAPVVGACGGVEPGGVPVAMLMLLVTGTILGSSPARNDEQTTWASRLTRATSGAGQAALMQGAASD